MKLFKYLMFFLIVWSSNAQRAGLKELLQKYPHDTVYVYLPLYENQENRHQYSVRLSKNNNYFDQTRIFYHVKDTVYNSRQIGFVKSKYMNFDMKIPDVKLIDTTWINENQDKIIYPEIFQNYQMVDVHAFFIGKFKYLIEEENFFGDKIYAREVRLYSTYRMPE
ncbi:MAG: hypothetical protein ACQESK_04660 [Bacteroidota bacterium]